MKIKDMISEAVSTYIKENGTENILSRREIFEIISKKYDVKYGSIIPTDYCYNRYNFGVKKFKDSPHFFEYIKRDTFKVIGENQPYSGCIYHKKKGDKKEQIVGKWQRGALCLNEGET